MIEQPPPGISPQSQPTPPVNQAQGCFRALLWVMPAVFAVASAWGISVTRIAGTSQLATAIWIVLNLAFIGTAGWFDAVMSRGVRRLNPQKRAGKISGSMVAFFLAQLALIPLIVAATVFAFCAFVAR